MYGWQNEAGEPIMSGEAYRFEQALDEQYAAERFLDDDEFFGYDDEREELDEQDCQRRYQHGDCSSDGTTWTCDICGLSTDEVDGDGLPIFPAV